MKNKDSGKVISLFVMWMLLLLIMSFNVYKTEMKQGTSNITYISSNYDVESYEVNLDVDKTNKVDVTEKITINIPEDGYQGMYRLVPLWEKYYDKDLKYSKKKLAITNIRVTGEKVEISNARNNLELKIGNERTTVDKGIKTYNIKYRVNMGVDHNENFDELVYNIFDNYDNTKINNLSISIKMPSSFDESKVLFLIGNKSINEDITYYSRNNVLYATLENQELTEPLTVNMTLPDNYFIGSSSTYGYMGLIVCVLNIIISIYTAISWTIYGKDYNKRSETIEFNAPNDYDAATIGYIYGEKSIKKLITSLIIGLASKGYISITEENNKYKIMNLYTENSKLKPLSIAEQLVYQQLFRSGNINILSEDNGFSDVFTKVSTSLVELVDKRVNDTASSKRMNTTFIFLFLSVLAWTISYIFVKDLDPRFEILYLISFASIFVTGFFTLFMGRKTIYGESISAQVNGFRDFLNRVEKNNVDTYAEKNPNYFYDVLPYVYVLGISKKWIETFGKENISNINLDDMDSYENRFFMII